MIRRPAFAAAIFHTATIATGVALSSAAAMAQSPAPPAANTAPGAIRTLGRAELDALLARPESVLVIDVRHPDEIATIGGFPAFLSIQSADIARLIAFVPHDRQVVTVSNHAHRAVQAGALLAARGYRVAGAVGAQDYEAQGGTLVGKRAAAGATAPAARTN